jgi:hypothetical protein
MEDECYIGNRAKPAKHLGLLPTSHSQDLRPQVPGERFGMTRKRVFEIDSVTSPKLRKETL